MSPENQYDEREALRSRVAELEEELRRSREQHQASERRFQSVADAAPVMMWIAGTDALVHYVNSACAEFRGHSASEELGNGWAEGVHPDDRDVCLEAYLKAFTGRKPIRSRYRLQRADGEYSWVTNYALPQFEDGRFAGYVGAIVVDADRASSAFIPDESAVRMVLSLTERERQVLALIADGRSTKQAAARLGAVL